MAVLWSTQVLLLYILKYNTCPCRIMLKKPLLGISLILKLFLIPKAICDSVLGNSIIAKQRLHAVFQVCCDKIFTKKAFFYHRVMRT